MASPTKSSARVPKLRFPEFKKAGAWEEKKLGDVALIVRGGSPRPIDDFLTNESAGINWLKIGDVEKEAKYVTRTQEKVIPAALSKTRVVNSGDLILSNSMSFGRPYILKIRTCIHDGWIAVTEINKSIDRDFLYYLIMAPDSQEYFEDNAAGSGVQNLNADIIKLLPIKYTNPPEQQKIADCLSSLDDLIAAHIRKHESLKTYKKSLMQQLFPQEGETVPRLRFPEFKKAGAWEERKVSSLLQKISKPVDVIPNQIYQEIGIRSHGKGIFHKEFLTGEAIGNKRVFWVEEKAFIVNIVFAWEQAVAITTESEKGMIASHRFPMYFPKEEMCDVNYIKHFFLTKKGKALLGIASPGGAGRNKTLGQKEFDDIRLLLPKNVLEQQKIANCLTSLDNLIAAQVQKIETLKKHKKGLMQQLFPASAEENP